MTAGNNTVIPFTKALSLTACGVNKIIMLYNIHFVMRNINMEDQSARHCHGELVISFIDEALLGVKC